MPIAFWIADGGYVPEALESMKSLKRHMDIRCVLGSTRKIGGFDSCVQLTPRRYAHWYRDSVRYMGEILDNLEGDLLCLDSDTYACGPMDEVFELLERFDLVGAHAPLRETSPRPPGVPKAFPELNIGVLAFKNNAVVKELFADWLSRYDARPGYYGNNDQGPLREALWHWDGRFYVMPPEYNCRWAFGGFAAYEVRMLHSQGNHEQACRDLNKRIVMRGWKKGEM